MTKPAYDVAGIGNAIVDVLAFCEDSFLEEQALSKGGMALIDEDRAEALYGMMGPATECSGGSVANTLAGLAMLGGKGAFVGKVRNDQLGTIFRHDLRSLGVAFDTSPLAYGNGTARSFIFVTPDGQRTMNTFLGACSEVSEEDIDPEIIKSAQVTYVEGYLWDQPPAIAAIRKAIEIARGAGRKVAFSLSDGFCVERHRAGFMDLVEQHLDILFANEQEIMSLFETDSFEACVKQIQGKVEVACLTRSEQGSVLVTAESVHEIAPQPVTHLVDSTGAGDLYAAGFLYGYTQGWSAEESAHLGSRCAAEIIQQLGARSQKGLKALVA